MRISVSRALIMLALGLAGSQEVALAQYSAPTQIPSAPNYGAYYSQTPAEGSRLTGANTGTAAAPTCNSCCDDIGTWRENTLFLFGAEAYKSLGDTVIPPGGGTGFMDSAGLVGAFNTGFALMSDSSIRGQIGGSYGFFDLKGRDTVSQSSSEQQTFLTFGVYKRGDICCDDAVSWGLVYDQFFAHQWGLAAGELYVGQVRGIVGYAIDEYNEAGVWGAFRATGDDSASVNGGPVRAMNQYNIYWRHNYDFGGQTMLYLGANDPADVGSWLLGLLGQAPLSDNCALYGNFTLSFPGSATGAVGSNELEWNVGTGVVYSWGGKAVSPTVTGHKGLPLLPVANNGSFLITN